MTTKELINQYITAHADNRWMDASELETLLTEFAEKLKEPASEDLEQAAKKYAEEEYPWQHGYESWDSPIKDFKAGAQWQREQMMRGAIECNIDYYDGSILDCTQKQLDDALEKNGIKVGDKVKLIIIKE